MKKTISLAALAISASGSFAFIGPWPAGDRVEKTYCLDSYTNADGGVQAGGCDESANNQRQNLQLNTAGCAEGQIALSTFKSRGERNFPITISTCMPPNATQL